MSVISRHFGHTWCSGLHKISGIPEISHITRYFGLPDTHWKLNRVGYQKKCGVAGGYWVPVGPGQLGGIGPSVYKHRYMLGSTKLILYTLIVMLVILVHLLKSPYVLQIILCVWVEKDDFSWKDPSHSNLIFSFLATMPLYLIFQIRIMKKCCRLMAITFLLFF